MKADIRKIYSHCFKSIGGEENEDISYLRKRPKVVGLVPKLRFGNASLRNSVSP
jgi:hypothetical protein